MQNSAKIFQGGSGASCCRLAYKITAVCGHVKGGGLSRRSSRPLTCRLAAGQSGMRSAFGMVSPYVRFLHAFKKSPHIFRICGARDVATVQKIKGRGTVHRSPFPLSSLYFPPDCREVVLFLHGQGFQDADGGLDIIHFFFQLVKPPEFLICPLDALHYKLSIFFNYRDANNILF